MTPQAYSYARFSSARQALGTSLERQLAIAREWHGREIPNLPLSDLRCDNGKSARKGAHLKNGGSLGAFLQAVHDGKISKSSVLICENLDRISRQGPKLARKIIEKIVDNGVDIHIVNISVKLTYGWEDDTARSVVVDVELRRAWSESQSKSERSSRNWRIKKDKAVNGFAITKRLPTWLTGEVGEKAVVVPERGATVERIFQLAANGMGCKRIVRTLTAEGRKPFTNGKQGEDWSPEFIQKTLRNPAVLGTYQPFKLDSAGKRVPDGDPIQGFYPGVVSVDLWTAANQAVRMRNRVGDNHGGGQHTVNNLFGAIVFDVQNDRVMSYWKKADKKGKKPEHPYMVTRWQKDKKAHYLRYDQLEEAMLDFFSNSDWREIGGHTESQELKAAQESLNKVQTEIDAVNRRIEMTNALLDASDLTPEGMKSAYNKLGELQKARAELMLEKEPLQSALDIARSRTEALYHPEILRELIQSENRTAFDIRLKLQAEIAKRIKRIDIDFEKKEGLVVFQNEAQGYIFFKN
jgi:DNA invertase Pin-like site-specific DNA recombinase